MGRFFLFGCLAFLVFNALVTLIALRVANAFGLVDLPPTVAAFGAIVPFAFIVVLAIGVIAGGGLRHTARPLGDIMATIDRVASGDYSARVTPRGPRLVRRVAGSLNAMTERLASAESQRRQLLADVTHELRTPLSVIQGRLEGVIDGVYPADEATLGAILDETRHMSRIIEDLRVLSLAESGALRLARVPIELGEIADDAIDAYRGAAETAGVALRNDVPPELPAADADPTRVREVLENLLSNAIRYTPAGGSVTVGARRDGDAMIAVTVADTGRGVSAEELPRLFERFHRSPDSHGTGLGLAIARDLVRAHGGEMAASSEGEGKGTAVRFTLPVAEVAG
jgi:signal transduction histidine kinase